MLGQAGEHVGAAGWLEFKLTGKLKKGLLRRNLVLTVTEMLRKLGWSVSCGGVLWPGIAELPLADRATIAE